jgi:hypothetical protein
MTADPRFVKAIGANFKEKERPSGVSDYLIPS